MPKAQGWPYKVDGTRMNCISTARRARRKIKNVQAYVTSLDALRELYDISEDLTSIEIQLIEVRSQPLDDVKGDKDE